MKFEFKIVSMATPFGSEKVITQHISEADLKTYFVGFDLAKKAEDRYRWRDLIDVLEKVIPEFAFGHHEGTSFNINQSTDLIHDAADAIYAIDDLKATRDIYLNGGSIQDVDIKKKYLKRGEFGELILHLLLRDFHNTIPLLSKIYFKDAYGPAVHGFDAIHIQPYKKILWLGESKLYVDPFTGIKELIEDVKKHFTANYLHKEFTIVSRKLRPYDNIPEKETWLQLMDRHTTLENLFKSVSVPLLCTFSSDLFTNYGDASSEFIKNYEKEMRSLKEYFDNNNDYNFKTNLNIILLLFPVKSKNELIKRMHKRLVLLQRGDE